MKYNDEHVPDSPTMVYVAPESGDAKLCTVHGLKDRGLDVRSVIPAARQLMSTMSSHAACNTCFAFITKLAL